MLLKDFDSEFSVSLVQLSKKLLF